MDQVHSVPLVWVVELATSPRDFNTEMVVYLQGDVEG